MIAFRKFDMLNISENEWALIHRVRKQIHAEDTPEDPIIDDKAFEIQMLSQVTVMGVEAFIYGIYEDDKFIGTFFFGFLKESSPSYKTNEKLVMFDIQLLKDYRRRGIGSKALKIMIDICEKNNRSVFITNSNIPETIKFFDAIGAIIAQKQVENRLKLTELDWDMIENWILEAQQINPKTKLITINGPVPEEFIEQYLKSYNESVNLQPKDEMAMGDMTINKEEFRQLERNNEEGNIVTLTTMTVEENGEISGFTELKRYPGKEKLVSQGLTGVPIKYRGKKLGKWTKASMLKFIKDKYPETEAIVTGNAESNDAMLYINKKLGFKKYRENVMAQVTLDQLKEYCKSESVPKIEISVY